MAERGAHLTLDNVDAHVMAALSDALALYAHDAPLSQAALPLLLAVDSACEGWRAALLQWGERAPDPVIACAGSLSAAEAERLRRALACWPLDETDREVGFVRAPVNEGPALAAAPLMVSDHRVVGALGLVARQRSEDGDGHPADPECGPTVRAIGRVLALMVEDRLSLRGLMQREAVLSSVLQTAPDAIVRIDAAGVIQDFNRAAERVFGHRAGEAIGEPLHMLMTDEHASRHQDYVDRYLRTGERRLENWRRRFEARRKCGAVFPVELAISELEVDGARQFVGVVRDVSDRVGDEERQEALREALQHAAQLSALGEMAAMIAHEVNQPLTAIANFVDAASMVAEKMEGPDAASLKDLLAQARSQAHFGGEVVRKVRRLTARRQVDRAVVDLSAVVEEALAYLKRTAAASGVTVTRRLAMQPLNILADRIQIQQVTANLARNALQAVAAAAVRDVIVETRADGDMAELVVADTGPGVPPERRSEIFNSFVTSRQGGVGLGLAVSRSIVEGHGGTIHVDDREGGGARFVVRLPLDRDGEAAS